MLARLVVVSIRLKGVVVALLVGLLAGGVFAVRALPIDAVPDVSTVQVSALTDAPGLSPVEVEPSVTFPIEMALNGMPNLVELRSVSRSGLSAATTIFKDNTNIPLALLIDPGSERADPNDLPPSGASHAR